MFRFVVKVCSAAVCSCVTSIADIELSSSLPIRSPTSKVVHGTQTDCFEMLHKLQRGQGTRPVTFSYVKELKLQDT